MSIKNPVLNVGIDLGTSRSSISSSNGQRHVVESYVGWPLDMVARKVMKKPVLIGQEALDNRSMLDLNRPLEEGLIKDGSEKDEAAVRELLWHLLSLVGVARETRNGMKVRAVVGVPAEALRVNKQNVRKAMQDAVDNLMIVSEPFAVAYGLEALLHTMIIDLGAGTTDFCVMNGRLPADEEQRTLTQAGDWIVESMLDLLSRVQPDYQEKVRNNIVVSGGTGLIRGLGPRLEQELAAVGGGKVKVVKDPVFVGSDGGLSIAVNAPDADWKKLTS